MPATPDRCPICLGVDHVEVGDHPDFPAAIRSCPSCSGVFCEWLPQQYLQWYYANRYLESRPSHADDGYESFLAQRAIAQLEFIGPIQPNAVVLDIGAGPGVFLRTISDPVRRFAVELDPNRIAELTNAGDVELVDFEELAQQHDTFDLIVLSHSFEHVTDPAGLLSRLALAAKSGARFFIEVPNEIEPMISGRSLKQQSDAHLQFYSAKTVESLVDRQPGLRIVSMLSAGVGVTDFVAGAPLDSFETRDDLNGVWLRILLERTEEDVIDNSQSPDLEGRLVSTLVRATKLRSDLEFVNSQLSSARGEKDQWAADLSAASAALAEMRKQSQKLTTDVVREQEYALRLGSRLKRSEARLRDSERHLANARGRLQRIEREAAGLRMSTSYRVGRVIVKPTAAVVARLNRARTAVNRLRRKFR